MIQHINIKKVTNKYAYYQMKYSFSHPLIECYIERFVGTFKCSKKSFKDTITIERESKFIC